MDFKKYYENVSTQTFNKIFVFVTLNCQQLFDYWTPTICIDWHQGCSHLFGRYEEKMLIFSSALNAKNITCSCSIAKGRSFLVDLIQPLGKAAIDAQN